MIESLQAYLKQSVVNRGLFVLLLVFTGAALSSFFGFLISELFLGIPLFSNKELLDNLSNPELLPALRLTQILMFLGMMIIPAIVYLWLTDSTWLKHVFTAPVRQPILICIALFMVAFPFINFVAEWNSSWNIPTFVGDWMHGKEAETGDLTKSFLNMPNVGLLILNLLMIGLLPALGEELIFRGVLQGGLQRYWRNPHLAIWVTAIVFSAVHFQFLGFVPRMLMGAAMGYLFFWSGNLWYPIIAHFTNNAMAVVLSYGIQHGSVRSEIENAGIENGTMAALSLLFCLMLLYVFKKHQESVSLVQ